MKVFKDGNEYYVVRDNFVNLQESPAVFFREDSEQGKILAAHLDDNPILWLPMGDLRRVSQELRQQEWLLAQKGGFSPSTPKKGVG